MNIQADEQLLALQQKYPEQYINMNLDDDVDNIICYVKQGQDPNSQWKILSPASMLDKTVKWLQSNGYSQMVSHGDGTSR